MLEIRKAGSNDAQIIALLGRTTFTETFGHLFPNKEVLMEYYVRTFSVDKIRNGLQKPENVFWIAFWDELPVGYAKLKLDSKSDFLDSDKVCQLQKIYVLKDFLSKKIGLALQNEIWEEARRQSFKKIWLSVVTSNKRAIHFYEKTGFTDIGAHDFQIGPQKFSFRVMAKKI